MLVICAGAAYFLALGMLLPVVPLYVEDSLSGGSVAVGVAVGAFSVGAILLRPLAGRLGDRFGRRGTHRGRCDDRFALGVALRAVRQLRLRCSRSGCSVAIGEAAFFVGAGTLVTDLAPVDRRGEAISYWSVAVYGGLAFGPALGETAAG